MNWEQILTGDCRDILPTLEPESVQTCITSPPYWGLRDYGVNGVLGLESTPEEYLANMVAVFRAVWRVLKPDATCWINMGDSYATNGYSAHSKNENAINGGLGAWNSETRAQGAMRTVGNGLKPKDLCMMPARLAMALQADGWWLRQDIIWEKSNPMPESVRDRCCKSHEYIFLLSKNSRYYFDGNAIKEPASYQDLLSVQSESSENLFLQEQTAVRRFVGEVSGVHDDGQEGLRLEIQSNAKSSSDSETLLLFEEGPSEQDSLSAGLRVNGGTAGKVSNSKSEACERGSLQGANEALLAEPKRKGDQGTKRQTLSANGQREVYKAESRDQAQASNPIGTLYANSAAVVGDQSCIRPSVQILRERTPAPRNGSCDTSLKRRDTHGIQRSSSMSDMQCEEGKSSVVMRTKRSVWHVNTQAFSGTHFATFPEDLIKPCILAGSRLGDTVLDPFAGSGTTGKVALELGRRAILIELNPAYIELARDRTFVTPGFL